MRWHNYLFIALYDLKDKDDLKYWIVFNQQTANILIMKHALFIILILITKDLTVRQNMSIIELSNILPTQSMY